MVGKWWRTVSDTVTVNGNAVELSSQQEYSQESPLVPLRAVVTASNGLRTEGTAFGAWQEMLQLLGSLPSAQRTDEAAPPAIQSAPEATEEHDLQPEPEPLPQVLEELEVALRESPAVAPEPFVALSPTAAAEPSPALSRAVSAADEFGDETESDDAEADDIQSEDDENGTEGGGQLEEDTSFNPNILQESLIRTLNRRLYSDDPPLEIPEETIAFTPHISCTQEAANVIGHIEENIKLAEMQADAARRATKLKYLRRANRTKRCAHVKFSGEICGSPALRGQQYCHYHVQTHAPSVEIPVIEDQHSLQVAFTRLAHQVATNKIEPAKARVLLQIIESAGRNLAEEASGR